MGIGALRRDLDGSLIESPADCRCLAGQREHPRHIQVGKAGFTCWQAKEIAYTNGEVVW